VLEESSPKTRTFAFYLGKALSVKQADLWDIFKKASKCVCNSTFVVSPHPLSPASSTFSALKTSEHTEEESDDLELADDEDIQMEYTSDWLYSPSKKLCQYRYPHLTVWNIQ